MTEVRTRPTDEEIAAKRAAKLAARPPLVTYRQKFHDLLKELGAESFVEMEADGRVLVNGATVFFTHYRNERVPKRWIVRHPETAYLKENRAISMAYYFPNENEVHASVVVKSEGDQYNRRAGNLKAIERLLKGDAKHCVAVEAQAISQFVASLDSTASRLESFLELLSPARRKEAAVELQKAVETTHPKDLSHYAVQDALVEAFVQSEACHLVRDAVLPNE